MKTFDVIVIGGGITGATATNHLAAAGYETLLLEAGDFGGGTTSRTSRLQYCGLSYLVGFDRLSAIAAHPLQFAERVALASRSMRERSAFVRASRERLREVEFYLPVYAGDRVPAWKMRAGYRALGALDAGGVGVDFRFLDAEAAGRVPILQAPSARGPLVGAIRYVEYQYDWPERICLDTVMNAADKGAGIANYTPVRNVERNGEGWLVTYENLRDGTVATVRARALVNAAGAWVDDIAAATELPVRKLNQGEKGANIALRLPAEFRGQGLQTLARDGSPFYLIPWGDLHYAGPVNRPSDARESGFVALEEEIAALVAEVAFLFPALSVTRRDVIYSWAGVRPRTRSPSSPSGAAGLMLHGPEATGLPGYFVYTGGLLMMHGHMGREVAEGVSRLLKPSGPRSTPVVGPHRPNCAAGPDEVVSVDGIGYSHALLNALAVNESVWKLDDLMFRRTPLGWNERLGTDTFREVAGSVRESLGWSNTHMETECDRYRAMLEATFGFATETA